MFERHGFKNWLGVLPGWPWLQENEHKLDGWQPIIETSGPGFKHTLTVKPSAKGVVASVMKANK